MTEPPSKRRRPDSRQMWDASDRHAPLPSRERDEPPATRDRSRRDDRDNDRDRRRYRSRSPRDSRGRGDRDDREGYRSGGPGRGGRDSRDRPRERSRDKDRERYRRRSRSPRRENERARERDRDKEEGERDREGKGNRDSEKDRAKELRAEHTEDLTSRSATPPVSFKVGGTPQPHEYEKMDVEEATKPKNKSGGKGGKKNKVEVEPTEEDEDIVVEDDGMAAMQAMMGFGGFGTTHQQKVAGNDVYAVRKEKKTEYRQYMNRVGGFNRPLSPGK
jgi:U4/U6.U5 tri-snRNP-associated protein 3